MSWHPTSAVADAVYDCGFEYEPGSDIIKSRMYAWQRQTGYCWAYDMAAAHLSMIIDCEPFYFVHNDKLWLIELWKGQYGLETGAEIGLYRDDLSAAIRDDHNLPFLPLLGRSRFFSCVKDDECLTMQFRLFRKGEFLFQRGPEPHWWLTGFRWGLFTRDTSDLTMQLEITGFPSTEMRDSFARSAILKFYFPRMLGKRGIGFTFDQPHSPQPASRVALAPQIQKHNERLVNHYNSYKKWRGFTNNDPNHITELDEPAARVLKAVSTVKSKIRSVPLGAKALDAVSAAATKVKTAMPGDVVTEYHEIHDFFHKNRRTWHVISRPGA
jgi:hypothetical protein